MPDAQLCIIICTNCIPKSNNNNLSNSIMAVRCRRKSGQLEWNDAIADICDAWRHAMCVVGKNFGDFHFC